MNPVTNGVPDALRTFDAQTRGATGDVITGALGTGLLGNGKTIIDSLVVALGAAQD